jgi:hypothetical protein
MEDRELLEMAAKAVGIQAVWSKWYGRYSGDTEGLRFDGGSGNHWNPLGNDGDAFRLALQLQIKIEYEPEMDSLMCSLPGSQGATSVAAIGDIELRYAIVRAAAQLGLTL